MTLLIIFFSVPYLISCIVYFSRAYNFPYPPLVLRQGSSRMKTHSASCTVFILCAYERARFCTGRRVFVTGVLNASLPQEHGVHISIEGSSESPQGVYKFSRSSGSVSPINRPACLPFLLLTHGYITSNTRNRHAGEKAVSFLVSELQKPLFMGFELQSFDLSKISP